VEKSKSDLTLVYRTTTKKLLHLLTKKHNNIHLSKQTLPRRLTGSSEDTGTVQSDNEKILKNVFADYKKPTTEEILKETSFTVIDD
jgi:hypothetical protein